MINRNCYSLLKNDADLLKHARNFLSGEFLNKAVAFFAIPVITRLLTPEEYGILTVFYGLLAIMTVFASLNIYTSVGRYYFEDGLSDFRQFLSSVTVFSLIFGSLFLSAALFIDPRIVEKYLAIDRMVLLYSAAIALELAILRIYLKYLQVRSLSKVYTLLAAFRGSLVLGLSIVLIILLEEEKYFGRIYGQFYILLLLAIYAFVRIWKLSKFHFSWNHIRYGLQLSIPLIPHSLSLIILAESDRFLINSISGSFSAGIYGFSYQIAMILGMIISSFNLAWSPKFYKILQTKDYEKLQRDSKSYSMYIYIFYFIAVLFSEEAVFIMGGPKYREAQFILPALVTGILFTFFYTFYINYVFYQKKTILVALSTLLSASVNIILNVLLIPKFGYQAAAYTTLASYILLALLSYLAANYLVRDGALIRPKILLGYIWLPAVGLSFSFLSLSISGIFYIEILSKITVLFVFLYFVLRYSNGRKI